MAPVDMGIILGGLARLLVALVQALPLSWGARIGRAGGAVAWFLDRRHRRVALENLGFAFGNEYPSEVLRDWARENFRRLGENYVSALKTASMDRAELAGRLEWLGLEEALPSDGKTLVAACGHFGNFELFARAGDRASGWGVVTTYRALRQPALNRVLQALRGRSGARFFERTREAGPLREAITGGRVILGLLSDQHAGDKGLWLPFFGRPCSTTAAPAVYALRYRLPLCTAVCYRIGLGRWRIEMGPRIPTHLPDDSPRPPEEIMREVNEALEIAIRRDPANWFWVHRRWKPVSRQQLRNITAKG